MMDGTRLTRPFGVRLWLALAVLAPVSLPAMAQDDPQQGAVPPPAPQPAPAPAPAAYIDGEGTPIHPTHLTVGGGVALVPSYEGSNNYLVRPIGALRAQVKGFAIATRGTELTVDLVRDRPDARWKFLLGPAFNLNLNRVGQIADDRVRALGKRHVALEVGGTLGVSRSGLITPYDVLSVHVDVLGDVSGVNRSHAIVPTIDYGTPLSRRFYAGASFSASIVGDRYARTYFAVSPAGSIASGLPVYADPRGGLKSWSLTAIATRSLTGDLKHGLGLYAAISYSRLEGDFAASPIVAIAGNRNQLLTAIGLGYTF